MLPPLYDLDQLFEAIRRGFFRDFGSPRRRPIENLPFGFRAEAPSKIEEDHQRTARNGTIFEPHRRYECHPARPS